MKTIHHYSRLMLVIACFALSALSGFAQTEGSLVTEEEQRKEITRVQDRALERKLKVEQMRAADSPVAQANNHTRTLLQDLQADKLEDASRLYFEGVQAGIPQMLTRTADDLEKAAKEAAEDASRVVRWTRAAKAAAPAQVIEPGLRGASTKDTDAVLREVDEQSRQFAEDLKDYAAKVSSAFPELRHVLADAGLSPASLREIVAGRMKEADQLAYRAKITRLNALLWEHLPRIIKTRAATGGKGQSVITNTADETIRAAADDKML